LAEEIAKKNVFLLEESVWHRYRPAILASWHVFSGRYSDLFPNPVANLQLLAMESPRDADILREERRIFNTCLKPGVAKQS